MEAAQHLVHFSTRVRVGNHRVTGRLGAAVTDTDEQGRKQQTVVSAGINSHDNAQRSA